jgi:tetratricopeptide (TPR) repeat protein
MRKKTVFLIAIFLVLVLQGAFSQRLDRLQMGIDLFGQGRLGEAVVELRRAQQEAQNSTVRAEAQFWIAMSELSAAQYNDAIHDLDEITRIDPLSIRRFEVPYQKARALYYLENYNDAIVLFKQYADSIRVDGRYVNGVRSDNWYADSVMTDNNDDYNRKSAAIYWIGECLYNLSQYDKAEEMFNTVVTQYIKSHKYEAATSRLALIKQKKIESELLDMVKWASAEQSVHTSNNSAQDVTAKDVTAKDITAKDVAATDASYEDAILAYKNSIAPYLMRDGASPIAPATPVAPATPAMPPTYTYPQNMYPQNTYPQNTYPQNTMTQNTVPKNTTTPNERRNFSDPDTIMRLLTIKTQALEMTEKLHSTLYAFENFESEGW